MQKLEYDRDEIIRTITQIDRSCGTPSVSREYITVKLTGRKAMFAEPMFRLNKKTYKVPTFSAIRNILQAIYWHPGMNWVPVFCGIRKPIKTMIVSTNGIEGVNKADIDKPIQTDKSRMLCSAEYLVDVEYYIKAYIVTRPKNMESHDDLIKFNEIAKRRIQKGQCFDRPFFGTRECPCDFGPIDPDEWNDPNLFQDITMDLGYMAFDFDYSTEPHTPLLKPMVVQKGKIFYLKGELLQLKGGTSN